MPRHSRDDPSKSPFTATNDGGRVHPEPDDPLRGPFEVDRHRIISCTAFRRLEQKTQVFAPAVHDHFRTRMTHTIEVAGIARTLAKLLRADETLAEAISLAHDLGHPPFGHAGEAALDERMAGHGGFDHNAHSLRVVEYLEHPYPAFRGLNLTRATLAGMGGHATRYDAPAAAEALGVESQVASLADRIAYDLHDLEDAIGAGWIAEPDLQSLSLWCHAVARMGEGMTGGRIHAVRRSMLDAMLDLLLTDASRCSNQPVVRFTEPVESSLSELESFLSQRVYRHPEVVRSDDEGRDAISRLFDAFLREPKHLPPRFSARISEQGAHRVICDYIAGMTDRFCRDCLASLGRVRT